MYSVKLEIKSHIEPIKNIKAKLNINSYFKIREINVSVKANIFSKTSL